MENRKNNEIIHFKRIMMSLMDIKQAKSVLNEVSSLELSEVMRRASEEAIIISYSRPFSNNDTGSLRNGYLKKMNANQKRIHERVSIQLRNQVVGHSDSQTYGVTFNVTEVAENKWVWPLMHKMEILLDKDDLVLLKENCELIESWLFDEQNRVKNYLPCGNY